MRVARITVLATFLCAGLLAAAAAQESASCGTCFRVKILGEGSASGGPQGPGNPETPSKPGQQPEPEGGISLSPLYLPDGMTGTPYLATVSATGSNGVQGPFTYEFSNVPGGLGASGGTLSSNPNDPWTFNVQVTVQAASGEASTFERVITIKPGVMAFASLPRGKVGQPYSGSAVRAYYGSGGPYAVTLNGLPSPLQFDAQAGQITGTPAAPGSYQVAITARDSSGREGTSQATLTIDSDALALAVRSTRPNPVELKNQAYAARTLVAENAVGTPHYAIQSGAPPGMQVDSATGVVSGTATTPGTYNVTFSVTDSIATASAGPFQITVQDPVGLDFTYDAAEMNQGDAVDIPPRVTGVGSNGYYCAPIDENGNWGSQGLFPGVRLDGCNITGIPTEPGTYTYRIRVTDNDNWETDPGKVKTLTTVVKPTDAKPAWDLLTTVEAIHIDYPNSPYFGSSSLNHGQRKEMLRDGSTGGMAVIGAFTFSGDEGGWDYGFSYIGFSQPALLRDIQFYVTQNTGSMVAALSTYAGMVRVPISGTGWITIPAPGPIYGVSIEDKDAESWHNGGPSTPASNGSAFITEMRLNQ